jgi:hypothetical protein
MATGDLLPLPKAPRLLPMTEGAARAWLASYNAYAARMRAYEDHWDSRDSEPMEQPDWVDGSLYPDHATPRSCIDFSVRPGHRPLAHIRMAGSAKGWDGHRPPHADPALIIWAGWRQHPRWDGTEPMPGEPGREVQVGRRLVLTFARPENVVGNRQSATV